MYLPCDEKPALYSAKLRLKYLIMQGCHKIRIAYYNSKLKIKFVLKKVKCVFVTQKYTQFVLIIWSIHGSDISIWFSIPIAQPHCNKLECVLKTSQIFTIMKKSSKPICVSQFGKPHWYVYAKSSDAPHVDHPTIQLFHSMLTRSNMSSGLF